MDEPATPFDPSQFNDPLAEQVAWGPLEEGGAPFRTHYYKAVNSNRIEFRATGRSNLFAGLFVILGVFVGLMYLSAVLAPGIVSADLGQNMVGLISLVFFGAALGMLYIDHEPIVFDKERGWYWKGRRGPHRVASLDELESCAELAEVHALQLVAETLQRRRRWFLSFELNLVLKSGERVNVVDHGDLDTLRYDTKRLADFLGVPVWDVV
ncbi:MAG: hypothetical protein AAGA11_18725 [Pseudomonadota bacterium]